MSDQSIDSIEVTSTLPGAEIIAHIRRLLVITAVAGVAASMFLAASKGSCAGGFDADGGFIDSQGRSTDIAPQCVQLTLGPSPILWIGFAVIVLATLGAVLRADDQTRALLLLDRAVWIVLITAVAAVVISQVWFALSRLPDPGSSWSVFSPFPFGSVSVEITPMTAE